MRFCQ